MFPWYAGRSKWHYYDEEDGLPVETGFRLSELLFFPFGMIFWAIIMLLFSFFFSLAIAGHCTWEICKQTLGTLKTGKLAHPFLTYAGGLSALLLALQFVSGLLEPVSDHILYVVLSIWFSVVFTLLPLLAVLLHGLAVLAHKILRRLALIKPSSCLLVFIGLVIAWGLLLEYLDQKGTTPVIYYSP